MIENLQINVTDNGTVIVARNIQMIGAAAQSANKPLAQTNDILKDMRLSAGALGAAIGIGFLAHEAADAADSYTLMENKLRSVGVEQKNLLGTTNALINAALATRTGIDEVATTFQRLEVATSDLKISQQEVLDMTTTLSKSIQMSGASATAAKAGLYQLAEGMEANRLQGIHLKALITDLPMLAKQIAGALGTNIDGLRKMGSAGELTAEKLTFALGKIKESVDAGFSKTMPTIANAFTNLHTRIVEFIGQANNAYGVGILINKIFEQLGKHLDVIALGLLVVTGLVAALFIAATISKIIAFSSAMYGVAAAILTTNITMGALVDTVWLFTLAIIANPIGALIGLLVLGSAAILAFGDKVDMTAYAMENLGDKTKQCVPYTVTLKDYFISAMSSIWDGIKSAATGILNIWQVLMGDMVTDTEHSADAIGKIFDGVSNRFQFLKQGIEHAALSLATRVELNRNAGDQDAQKRIMDNYNQEYDAITKNSAAALDGVSKAAAARAKERYDLKLTQSTFIGSTDADRGKHPHTAEHEEHKKSGQGRQEDMAIKQGVELEQQLANMYKIKEVRTDNAALAKIDAEIAVGMTPAIKERLRLNKDLTIEIQKQAKFQPGFDSAVADSYAQKEIDYTRAVEGANIALKTLITSKDEEGNVTRKSLITQQDYDKTVTKLTESYKRQNDEFYDFKKEIADQAELYGLVGKALEDAIIKQDLRNKSLAAGIDLNIDYNKIMGEDLAASKIKSEYDKKVTAELVAINDQYAGSLEKVKIRQDALNLGKTNGTVGTNQFIQGTVQNKITKANTNLQNKDYSNDLGGQQDRNSDIAVGAAGKLLNGYTTAAAGISEAFGNTFVSIKDGFADAAAKAIVTGGSMKDMLSSLTTSIETELVSSLIKVGAQYLVNAALFGTAEATKVGVKVAADGAMTASSLGAMALTEAASIASAIAQFAAWLPTALTASVGSFGAAAVIGGGALLAAWGAAKAVGIAHDGIDNIPREGTWLLDEGERVVDKRTNGDLKDFLSNPPKNSSSNSGSKGVNITFQDYGTSKTHEVQQISETEIRIIARDEGMKAVVKHAPTAVANSLSNPNSKMSKAVGQNTQAQRNRV